MALSMILLLLLQLRVRARAGVYPCAPYSDNAAADAWCPDQAQSNMICLCIYQGFKSPIKTFSGRAVVTAFSGYNRNLAGL